MEPAPLSEPFERFAKVFAEAKAAVPKDPNAMTLATVDERGQPMARVVLLKDFDQRGFVFFTNYRSMKGRALESARRAGLNFYWAPIDQQVRVEGTVEKVPERESDEYFASRPRISQLGAWASEQSQLLATREELEARLSELTKKYEGTTVPRPAWWGGFRVVPSRIEFWKAHEFRLHWREQYVRAGDGWQKSWLNP
ncbi:MAG: pyridoxamine 5'-phosphate oxidase [Myxococcaceae bacterium]